MTPEEDQELHRSVSSDGNEAETDEDEEAGEENGLIEDGYEMAIHGGGTLEDVGGFDEIFALTEGFPAEDMLVEKELANNFSSLVICARTISNSFERRNRSTSKSNIPVRGRYTSIDPTTSGTESGGGDSSESWICSLSISR